MTTPNTDLTEQIADALAGRGIRFAYQIDPIEARALATAVLPIVEAAVKRGQAEAWEAGAQVGKRGHHPYVVANPYEETPDEH